MMTQENWDALKKAFEDEEKFNDGYADENDFEDLNLFDWLECDTSPSWEMRDLFKNNGYSVHCLERDSFSWLVGGVRKIGTNKVITFG